MISLCSVLLNCWERIFTVTRVVSWKNSAKLSPVSFWTPSPNSPVILGISWLLLLHSNPLWWKGTFFLVLILESVVGLHTTSQLQLLQHQCLGHRFGLLWFWMVCLETNWDHSVVFEIAPKYFILDSFIDCGGYSISSKGFLPMVVDIMVIWIKFIHFSSLIPKMLMFNLAISC